MQKFEFRIRTSHANYTTVAILEVPGNLAVWDVKNALEKAYNHQVEMREQVWLNVDR